MPKKKWKTEQVAAVLDLRAQGYEYSEISKKIHRPTEDIAALCAAVGAIKGERVVEKRLTCGVCQKPFARQSNLTVHMRNHTQDERDLSAALGEIAESFVWVGGE